MNVNCGNDNNSECKSGSTSPKEVWVLHSFKKVQQASPSSFMAEPKKITVSMAEATEELEELLEIFQESQWGSAEELCAE